MDAINQFYPDQLAGKKYDFNSNNYSMHIITTTIQQQNGDLIEPTAAIFFNQAASTAYLFLHANGFQLQY